MGGMDTISSRSQLLSDIEAFLAETGMGQSYFGKKAVGNSEVVSRLRDGRNVRLDTAEKIACFIKQHRHAEQAVSSNEDIQGQVRKSPPIHKIECSPSEGV